MLLSLAFCAFLKNGKLKYMKICNFFLSLNLKQSISFLQEFSSLCSHSLVKMSEEVCKVEIAQRGMGLRGSFWVRREERVRN
jgi:hypothetical protein